ncbi:MAG TPA: uracil-DNA glycosylase family protein [Bacteroidia bacterium]|nr:uracil-DNA glycosylase family protein [Bacteroidia bacterium]
MTLEGTPDIVTPASTAGLSFRDEVDTVNKLVPQLQAQGIEAIVVLIHEGGFATGHYSGCEGISGPIFDIVRGFDRAVDIVISGHTNAAHVCEIDGILVTSAAHNGRLITDIDLELDERTHDIVKKAAKNLVFADGNPAADLMFVGEAPGRDEDERGLPFVGVSGQLLDRFLGGIGRDRTSAYIVNVLPWRPPDNREPALAEASVCLPFLLRHIALVRPRIVVALGATAARNLLNTTEGITRLRGTWHTLDANHHTCQAMATFHPAALLRQPLNKRYVWRDFLAVAERLENFK